MACLNLSLPKVQRTLEELTRVFENEDIAYAVLSQNNGYPLELTPTGKPSLLYQKILKLDQVKGIREKALRLKARIYTPSFIETHGDWINTKVKSTDANGEPNFSVLGITDNEPTLPEFSLQDKALDFLHKEGKNNIPKLFSSYSYTEETPSKFKDLERLKNMLELSSEEFRKNGLFVDTGDKVIAGINAKLFEEIVDSKKLIQNINEEFLESIKHTDIRPHNVISSKQYNNNYYVVSTDERYSTDLSFEDQQIIRREVTNQNLKKIAQMNTKFEDSIGKPIIILQQINEGKTESGQKIKYDPPVYKVTFDEEVMKEYNSVKYSQYLDKLQNYMRSKDSDILYEMTFEPVANKLKQEKKQLAKDKSILETTGGNTADINKIENKITKLEERIKKIGNDGLLEDIYLQSEIDFKEIDDILAKPVLSLKEFRKSLSKLELWVASGDFSKKHPFLDEEQLTSTEIRDNFAKIGGMAGNRMSILIEKGKGLLANTVNEHFGTELSYEDVIKLTHKLGLFNKGLSLNRVGQALAQFIQDIVNKANDSALREAKLDSRDLAELYEKVKQSGFDDRDFYQFKTTKKGRKTPTGLLIHRFSTKYWDERRKTVPFRKDKQITLDPILLFESGSETKAKYIAELEKHLGKLGVEEYVEKAQKRWEDYKNVYENHIQLQYGTERLTDEQKADLKLWEQQNSPVERIKAINDTKFLKLKDVPGKDTFLVIVPRKFDKKGKDLGYYDNAFTKVESNPLAYEFYQRAKEITNRAQILFGTSEFKSTSIAYIERSLLSKLSKHGIADFLSKDLYDNIVKSFEGGSPKAAIIDPITGKPIKSIKTKTVSIDGKIKELAKKKIKEYELKHGEIDAETIEELYADASEEVFSNMNFDTSSTDLFQSLNTINYAALGYKHSSMIEDMVNIATTYLPNSTVEIGDDIIDSEGNPVAEKYIEQLKDQVNFMLESKYYKEPKGDSSSIIGRLKTKEQKERYRELQEKLKDPDLTDIDKTLIEKEINELGVKVTTNSILRGLMGFLRLKGLGWNIPASLINLLVGTTTNMYKAAEGRLYTMGEWIKAEREAVANVHKLNRIVENYGIIGDVLYEFNERNKFQSKQNSFMKVVKSLKPYALQTAVEKKNQGTTMIAMMLHQKVTNSKGEEMSMWEAIDKEGKLSNEWKIGNKYGDDAVVAMISKIESTVDEIHGDYRNAMLTKSVPIGQALTMFRQWIFETVHSRVGVEKPDYIRGIVTKGRYRTALELGKAYKFNPFAAYKAYKEGKLSEVDIANMRGNFAEMTTMALVLILQQLLKNAICGNDDKNPCKSANASSLFLMNTYKKLTDDLTLYGPNPKAWYEFIKNPIAATSLLLDIYKVYDMTYDSVFGGEEDLINQRTGEDKRIEFIISQTPFVNSIERLKKQSSDILNLGTN